MNVSKHADSSRIYQGGRERAEELTARERPNLVLEKLQDLLGGLSFQQRTLGDQDGYPMPPDLPEDGQRQVGERLKMKREGRGRENDAPMEPQRVDKGGLLTVVKKWPDSAPLGSWRQRDTPAGSPDGTRDEMVGRGTGSGRVSSSAM